MGLSDFILIIDRLGLFGIILVLSFILIMFFGALVDIYQFLWLLRRLKTRRARVQKESLKAIILKEHFEAITKIYNAQQSKDSK